MASRAWAISRYPLPAICNTVPAKPSTAHRWVAHRFSAVAVCKGNSLHVEAAHVWQRLMSGKWPDIDFCHMLLWRPFELQRTRQAMSFCFAMHLPSSHDLQTLIIPKTVRKVEMLSGLPPCDFLFKQRPGVLQSFSCNAGRILCTCAFCGRWMWSERLGHMFGYGSCTNRHCG